MAYESLIRLYVQECIACVNSLYVTHAQSAQNIRHQAMYNLGSFTMSARVAAPMSDPSQHDAREYDTE